MKRAEENEAKVIDNDPGSFEEYRDGFRFMASASSWVFCLTAFFILMSVLALLSKDEAKTYLSTRDGRLAEIMPIANNKNEMSSLYLKYENNPEKLLEIREFYNKNFHTIK